MLTILVCYRLSQMYKLWDAFEGFIPCICCHVVGYLHWREAEDCDSISKHICIAGR